MAHQLEYEPLNELQLNEALLSLPHWKRDGMKIRKQFEFDSFPEAIAFVNRVADKAQEMNHHPDIEIHFKKVDIVFWTHKKNSTTQADVAGAEEVEKLVS